MTLTKPKTQSKPKIQPKPKTRPSAKSGIDRPPLSWAVAELFPPVGQWSETEFLELSGRTNRLIELSNGNLEVIPLPTDRHQQLIGNLYFLLATFLKANPIGRCLMAGIPVRLAAGRIREPDLVLMLREHYDRMAEQYWGPPDLAVEVHSPDTRKADREEKRVEYAEAGIPEYWMIDPKAERLEVYQLEGEQYTLRGRYKVGDRITTPLLPGFELAIADVFAPI